MTLEGANLTGAKFDYASCNGCWFAGATLDEADMDYIKASSANFTAAALSDADLTGAELSGADLSYAVLSDAVGFTEATCSGAAWGFAICPSGKQVGAFDKVPCDPSCAA